MRMMMAFVIFFTFLFAGFMNTDDLQKLPGGRDVANQPGQTQAPCTPFPGAQRPQLPPC